MELFVICLLIVSQMRNSHFVRLQFSWGPAANTWRSRLNSREMFWWQFLFCPLTRRPSASECKSSAHNRIICNLLPKSTDFALPRSGVHPLSLFAQGYLSMQIQFRRVSESAFPWTSSDSLVGDDWLLNKVSSQIFRHRSAFSKNINPNKRQLWGPYHWNRNLFPSQTHIAVIHSRWVWYG